MEREQLRYRIRELLLIPSRSTNTSPQDRRLAAALHDVLGFDDELLDRVIQQYKQNNCVTERGES